LNLYGNGFQSLPRRTDIVEAIIQLPTDEFFNTGIYTYLWVLNKNKDPERKDSNLLMQRMA
jgi:type I restriction enzyme M protein